MLHTVVLDKIKTHILCSNLFLKSSVYEMWKNVTESDRPQMTTIRRIRIAYRINGYRHKIRICNTYCFRQPQWLCERVSMVRYTYIASKVTVSLQYARVQPSAARAQQGLPRTFCHQTPTWCKKLQVLMGANSIVIVDKVSHN